MKQIEAGRKIFDVAPCPFCGSASKIEITEDSMFYRIQGQHGTACVSIRCTKCNAEMYNHTHSVRNYEQRVKMLLDKWNTRAEAKE